VTHPFNPVYLLPLVELVGTDKNAPEHIDKASEILIGIGMYPLRVRAEIDAHIADRFLEAVWREALWLIKDGIATTEEIDDAIRYGFGLRWAQMGLFETYRIAGGEAGMRHFIEQFGPCLSWPWTKLMDVPELTDALIDKIADQSDAQSGAMTIRELERTRDDNLVTILRGLKAQDYGAGKLLNAQDVRVNNMPEVLDAVDDLTAPIVTVKRAVPLDWTDYNGTRIRIETQVLHGAGKKLHLFHRMMADDRLLATGEHMLIHVSLETRKASDPDARVAGPLARLATAHAKLAVPEGAGAAVGKR